jgi:hypothetical protein
VSAPTKGWDYLAQVTYVPEKRTEIYLRYRTETKPLNGSGAIINYPLNLKRQNLRLHFLTQVNAKLALKARTEMAWFQREGSKIEEGFLTYLEASYAPTVALKGNIRLQYFETESYDSRIYAYESDVLYSFSIPAFFDKGYRYYLNASYTAGKRLTLWIRLAQTLFEDKDKIGSGLDEIRNRHKTDMRLQVRVQL